MIKSLPFLLVVSLLTSCVEVDISVPSFPDISYYFNISDGLTQMTIALNFFGFCISSAIYGPLSDAWGRRYIMIVGNAIMLLGAWGCTLVSSIELLLLSRFIQGFGASTSAVIAFAMIADTYTADKSAKLIGTMNSLITIFMSLAPIVGAFINQTLGWKGNYITIATISLISWVMLYFWLPETKKQFSILSKKKIATDYKILLTNTKFMYASLVPSLLYSGWMDFVACGSFLYIQTYDLPIMYYAMHQGLIIVVFSFFSLYSAKISQLIGKINCVVYGVYFTLTGGLLMLTTSIITDNSPYLTTICMITYGVGAAISYPVVFTWSLEMFPNIKGTASSAIMTMRSLICSIFIAISSYIYYGKLITVSYMVLIPATLAAILSIKLLKLIPSPCIAKLK